MSEFIGNAGTPPPQPHMNPLKLVIALHSLYLLIIGVGDGGLGGGCSPPPLSLAKWSIVIFGLCCCVTALFGVFLHEITCNGMTSSHGIHAQRPRHNPQDCRVLQVNSQSGEPRLR